MSKNTDKTAEVVQAIAVLKNHQSDGLGECGCTHCQSANKTIDENPEVVKTLSPLFGKEL